jgi:hypothetical protein
MCGQTGGTLHVSRRGISKEELKPAVPVIYRQGGRLFFRVLTRNQRAAGNFPLQKLSGGCVDMKIDVHAHLFSPAYIQGLQRIFGHDSTPTGQDVQRLIRWMSSDPRMIDCRRSPGGDEQVGYRHADTLGANSRCTGAG